MCHMGFQGVPYRMSRGVHHVRATVWGVYGLCCVGCAMWVCSVGCVLWVCYVGCTHCMGCTVWGVLCGVHCMGCPVWGAPYGVCSVEYAMWGCRVGCRVGVLYRVHHVGVPCGCAV